VLFLPIRCLHSDLLSLGSYRLPLDSHTDTWNLIKSIIPSTLFGFTLTRQLLLLCITGLGILLILDVVRVCC
jgi:hypothetical protein